MSLESRQVAKRLGALLPARFQDLRRDHARAAKHRRNADGAASAAAERLALTDPRYLKYVEELTQVSGQAAEARVQYETHVMLFKARQTLGGFRRPGG